MSVLVLNAGSSTLKFGLFETRRAGAEDSYPEQLRGTVDHIGTADALLTLRTPHGNSDTRKIEAAGVHEACDVILNALDKGELLHGADLKSVAAVGYRVVHGGPFRVPTLITAEALTRIKALEPLAPLHNPADVALIEQVRGRLPDARHVAVFDTAFHWTMPEVASTYAIPYALAEKHGLRRYGFHGISHRYVSRLAQKLMHPAHSARLISCHLGNGCSVCAIHNGHSIDTSMGLTPLEGLAMGTRCGDIDPGLLLYLERSGMPSANIDLMLNKQSGLLGISGLSGDVRVLERAANTGDTRAFLALEIFAYRVAKYIGAYAVALDGLDAVLFTGGIGENSQGVRRRICRHLGVLGLSLDMARNARAEGHAPTLISADDSRAQIWILPTDEEAEIAREVLDLPASA